METQLKREKFLLIQSTYIKVTLALIILSTVLMMLGYGFVNSISAAPKIL